jgi:ATP-binding cassette, subfamily B, bacterial
MPQSNLQHDKKDCGPACLQAVARHHGRRFSMQHIRELCATSREGASMYGLSKAAEKTGLQATGVKMTYERLISETRLPCIAHSLETTALCGGYQGA